MERGEGGAIVNVSSQASQSALKEHTVYCKYVSYFLQTSGLVSLLLSPPTLLLMIPICVMVNSPGTAKGGLDMLTKVMGLELGPHKVNNYHKILGGCI